MKLIIANKNYSSWSLRAWLALKAFDVPFSEIKLTLDTEQFYTELAHYSPIGKVPVLLDDKLAVWDSLAICEYINDNYLDGKGWPSDKSQRARARSIAADMHSGFFAIRAELPMNCRAQRRLELSDKAKQEIMTLDGIWSELRTQNQQGGDFLFGELSFADMFFAPLAFRFKTYGIELSATSTVYQATMLALPAMQLWLEEALMETDVVDADEAGEPV